jgi:hypothetical protein
MVNQSVGKEDAVTDPDIGKVEGTVAILAIPDDKVEGTLAAIEAFNKVGNGGLFTLPNQTLGLGTLSGTICTTTGTPAGAGGDFNCADSDS